MDVANPTWLGFIVLTIVVGSLFIILLGSILVRPIGRTTTVFIGTMFSLLLVVVGGMWVAGKVLSLIIPK